MAFGDLIESVVDHQQGGTGTALSITFSAAPSEDYLILLWAAANDGFTIDSAGFTELSGLAVVDGVDEYRAYWKVAGASEGTTFSATVDTSTQDRCLMGAVFEGPFDAAPVDASAQGTEENASSSVECPTITATVSNSLGVAFGSGDIASVCEGARMNTTGDNGFTFGDFADGIANADSVGLCFAHKTLTASGAVGETRLQWTDGATTPVASNAHWGNQVNFKQGAVSGNAMPLSHTQRMQFKHQLVR